jgi:aryl-alcohol dehydrogenase-like predicted oxidoreductase
MATEAATWAYRNRFHESYGRTYFRRFGDALVSSIGVGTYLGEPTDADDEGYRASVVEALEHGCNVVDTAVNYRHQRSERVVGEAFERADVEREAVLLATKGGFLAFDGERPDDPRAYVREHYVEPGLVTPDDLARGMHALSPALLEHSLERSLSNLGVDAVDLYYVHNPELQLEVRDRAAVYDQLEAVFRRLEQRAADGDLRHYGVATWEAFRVPPDHERYLSLPEVVGRARSAAETAGNAGTHLWAVQLPFNVTMADAFTVQAHEGTEGPVSALQFCREAGLDVFTSASIGQSELTGGLPTDVAARLEGDTPVQRAINFARSAPGVTAALVGSKTPAHVRENLAAGTFSPMGAGAFDATFAT